ncbi:MAG: peptidoglycan editing factor PgeF [Syntrophotaleaceae bacterium]
MKLVRQGKISYMQPAWAAQHQLQAGFSTRNGGVSRPPYNSLNLAYNTEDARHNVEGNRSTLARAFDLQTHQLTVNQVHGSDILIIDEANYDLSHFLSIESDADVTNQPGIMIGVLVADCYPVLLFDPQQRAVAAVHVGWRGAASGLLKKTVATLQGVFGSRPEQLLAAVGPGIAAHKYTVDRPVRDAFQSGSGHWARIAKETDLHKWQLDLQKSCLLQLEDAGLAANQISAVAECTCCHRELFFSYRRDKGQTGRQMGFVLL